jgi:two-component system sensor histidine kinase YesM
MKALLAKLGDMKIKTKLLMIYFIMMALTVSIIYTVSATRINSMLLTQASNDLNSTTLQIKQNILNLLDSYEKATDYIVFNQTFINDISHESDTNPAKYDRTKDAIGILGRLKNIDPSISAIRVYMFDDTVLFDGNTFTRYDSAMDESLADLEAGISWIGRHPNSKKTSIVTLNRTIYDYPYTSKQIGILSVEIPESKFYEFIQKESLSKTIVIFNDQGDIVTASNDSLSAADLNRLLAKNTAGGDGQFEFKYNNTDFMLYSTMAANGWRIASYIPLNSLLSTTVEINRYVVIVILSSMVAFFLFTTILLNFLTKRISQFAKAAHRIGEGQYNFSLDIAGKDEIGQLADDFNRMIKRLDVLFNDVYVAQIKRKEAELQALQAQINPHFLYNVLSSIGFAALKKNAPEIRNALNDLAEFYRFSLSKGNSLVTLEEEINHVRTYMSIQNMRFGSMVALTYDIAPELRAFRILKLTIQPFVENAIHHAMRDSGTQLLISIAAGYDGMNVFIKVQDNGLGILEEKLAKILEKIQSGVEERNYGIQNVHNRIRLHFGEEYGVMITSVQGVGTTVTILLPPCG